MMVSHRQYCTCPQCYRVWCSTFDIEPPLNYRNWVMSRLDEKGEVLRRGRP